MGITALTSMAAMNGPNACDDWRHRPAVTCGCLAGSTTGSAGSTQRVGNRRGPGVNLNLLAGNVESVTDGPGVLAAYYALCEARGLPRPSVVT